ncbi:MAG: glycolate oxidase subunit GlcF [Magnetospiraceae bacterium]
MQTAFTPAQLQDPDQRRAEEILRKCVHCGFCLATCPTYVIDGNELDSPRGRIYQIKDYYEGGKPANASLTTHLDRCLTCLSCATTCPSGVDYGQLVDLTRTRLAKTQPRPLADRLLRKLLATVLAHPGLFRLGLRAAQMVKPMAGLLPAALRRMVQAAEKPPAPSSMDHPGVYPAAGERRLRIALAPGCAQKVLRPAINEATIRLLTRLGCDVVIAEGSGCCGALAHHLGEEDAALARVRANIVAWDRVRAEGGLDAIISNASGCGAVMKDYGFLMRHDPALAAKAQEIEALSKDVSEVIADLGLPPVTQPQALAVAFHAPCTLQHGQRIGGLPATLLAQAGYQVRVPQEAHLCCGSAGTYSLLQPDRSARLRRRKLDHLSALDCGVIATANIGCLEHMAPQAPVPIVHLVELLDWATGGPRPEGC